MEYTREVQEKLRGNPELAEIYKEVAAVPRDTLIATRHPMIDHVMGPQPLSEMFSSRPRYRPHESRLLMESYDPFHIVQGMTRVIGTAWLAGMFLGGVQGFYEGLAKRQMRSWRIAYQSLCSFSRTKAPLRANQLAACAMTCCLWEAIFRAMVQSNATHLEYGDKGLIMGRFGSKDNKQVWQTDGRMCAVAGCTMGALTLRLIKGGAGARPGVLLSNSILAGAGGYLYAHLWGREDYYDIEKKFLELM